MRRARNVVLALTAAATVLGAGAVRGDDAMSFKLASDAFLPGKPIPEEYTCEGTNVSPALHWDHAPAKTKAFALIVDDPDAPHGTFNHWVVYNIPDAAGALAKAVPPKGDLGDGTLQGRNGFGKIGYGGPCPPRGSNHRYYFKLYALSAPLDLEPGAERDAVLRAIDEKQLGKAELMGRYGR